MNEVAVIAEMVAARSIAVVGISADPGKASHYVSAYMQAQGCRIYPVNPGLDRVLGEKAYGALRELPLQVDVVNVFRLPRFIPAIVDEMIELGLKRLWVQVGIVELGAAHRAEAAGIQVVMDRCLMVEHRNLATRD